MQDPVVWYLFCHSVVPPSLQIELVCGQQVPVAQTVSAPMEFPDPAGAGAKNSDMSADANANGFATVLTRMFVLQCELRTTRRAQRSRRMSKSHTATHASPTGP